MCGMRRRKPRGFTFCELLVVIALLLVVLGLALPGLAQVRANRDRTVCLGRLRQLILACHDFQDQYGTFPPGYGWVGIPYHNGSMYGNTFYCLLPFVEMAPAFKATHVTGKAGKEYVDYYAWSSAGQRPWDLADTVATRRVNLFECPSDPSLPPTPKPGAWAHASYAGNGQVFGNAAADGSVFAYDEPMTGVGANAAVSGDADTQGYPKVPCSFGDGAAVTIVFAEKYARCGPGGGAADQPAGNHWGRPWDGDYDAPFFAYARSRTRTADEGAGHYVMPTNYRVRSPGGNARTVPEAVKFQVQPNPWRVRCNPFLASSAHPAGIDVALGDGSSRVVARDIEPAIWWSALTPNGKDNFDGGW